MTEDSKQRYFVWLSYDGTSYHGWQAQPGVVSVQGELEKALSVLLRRTVEVTGAGRTDSGVHARVMAAHFDWCGPLPASVATPSALVYKLNCVLPADIAISRVEAVAPDMHARFSARARTYHYYIHARKDPFLRAHSLELMHTHYDFGAMNAAAALLLHYDDFASFCKTGSDNKTTLCHVSEARWVDDGDGRWHFVITADRFLRNMVRAIVGTLLRVGRGALTVDGFRRVIERHDRQAAADSAPAHALFLHDIRY